MAFSREKQEITNKLVFINKTCRIMFENPYLCILLGWLTQVWAAEQLFSGWRAFTKIKLKLLSTACPQDKLQDCSLMVFRYSNSGIYLKQLNQNVCSIMPHPIWTQDPGFTAKKSLAAKCTRLQMQSRLKSLPPESKTAVQSKTLFCSSEPFLPSHYIWPISMFN